MGTVIFSLDVELGWGLRHIEPFPAERVTAAREAWRWLANLFDRLEVPVTWAIVGHLFLTDGDRKYRDDLNGRQNCSARADRDTTWIAGDLVERVVSAPVDHEVGIHGFTHHHFGREWVDRQFVRSELDRSLSAAKEWNIAPRSFVYPRNRIAYTDLLSEYNIHCYRGTQPSRLGGTRKLAAAAVDRWSPPLVDPVVDEHGLVNLPASMYLFSLEGRWRSLIGHVRGDPVVNAATRGLDALSDTNRVLHLWFHPNNLTVPADRERIRRIVRHARGLRDRGELNIETMASVADTVLATPSSDR